MSATLAALPSKGGAGPLGVYKGLAVGRTVSNVRFAHAFVWYLVNQSFGAGKMCTAYRPRSLSRHRCIWLGYSSSIAAVSLTEKPTLLNQKTFDSFMRRCRFL